MTLDLLIEHFDPGLFFKSNKDVKNWVLSNLDLVRLGQKLTQSAMNEFIKKANETGFKRIGVPIASIASAVKAISENGFALEVIASVGHPYGNSTTPKGKYIQAEEAAIAGASAVEINMDLGSVSEGGDKIKEDLSKAVDIVRSYKKPCGIVAESRLIDEEGLKAIQQAVSELKPDYLGVSTGIPIFDEENGDYNGIDIYRANIMHFGELIADKDKLGIKVSTGIIDNDSLMEAMFYCTKAGWKIDNIRFGSEAGIEIANNIATTIL